MADLWEVVRAALILATLGIVSAGVLIVFIGLVHLHITDALRVIRKL